MWGVKRGSKVAAMERFSAKTLIFLMLALVVGCDQKELVRRFTPPVDDQMARQFLEDVRLGQLDKALPLVDPKLRDADGQRGLRELSDLLRSDEEKSVEIIGANTFISYSSEGKQTTVTLSYQLELSTGWFAGTVVILDKGETRAIASARFNRVPMSLKVLNRFTFHDKTSVHYLFLLLCVTIPVFVVTTLVICARSKIRKKWLWIIFILVGFVSFTLNWTTGHVNLQIINFQLLGASAFKLGLYAPWMLSFAIPVGAIVFLMVRERLLVPESPKPAGEPSVDANTAPP